MCRIVWCLAIAFLTCQLPIPVFAAGVFHVDRLNGSCSNSGPGTESQPYCSISAAIAARNGPGTTLLVSPGVYREQVTVPASGAAGDPFVLRAVGAPVTVDGSDDLSVESHWTSYAGTVFLAAGVDWTPLQVFVDGVRLTPSMAAPNVLPVNTFRHILPEGLYVNLGGDNPGAHSTEVGRRSYGFRLSNRSYVTIEGFDVERTEDRAIYLSGGASACTLRNNRVRFAYRHGIAISGGSGNVIEANTSTDNQDDGISLVGGATGCTIQDNESARNIHPVDRRAQGVDLAGAPGNLIRRNRFHHNQDSGEHLSASSNNNISIQNLSWSNGDHGYDRLNSSGTLSIGDVAFGNFNDGFSNEGVSSGGQMYNCIAIDNGLTTNRFDLWVDAQAAVGFVSNYNIFWNSTGQSPFKYITTVYPTIAAYRAASGQDAQSLQSDPWFVNAPQGDFHLLAGSPAIDAAHSGVANWPATDAEGRERLDDPGVPNSGAGPVAYADRGALERVPGGPTGLPPVVTAPAVMAGVEGSPLTVGVTASDPDAEPITSLTATGLPTGATFSPAPGNTSGTLDWTPTPGQTGNFEVTFTAANTQAGSAATTITVSPAWASHNLVWNHSFEVNTNGWIPYLGSTLERVPGGVDGVYSLRITGPSTTAPFGVNDSPNWLVGIPAAGTRYRFSARVGSADHTGEVKLRVREYLGAVQQGGYYSSGVTLSPAWQQAAMEYVALASGSTIDFQVVNFPVVENEVFQVDAVAIHRVMEAGSGRDPIGMLGAIDAGSDQDQQPLRPRLVPSPVRDAATLSFRTSLAGALRVELFDLAGRAVRRLLDRPAAPAGMHRLPFDGRDDAGTRLPSGLYFYRLTAAEGGAGGRLLILR